MLTPQQRLATRALITLYKREIERETDANRIKGLTKHLKSISADDHPLHLLADSLYYGRDSYRIHRNYNSAMEEVDRIQWTHRVEQEYVGVLSRHLLNHGVGELDHIFESVSPNVSPIKMLNQARIIAPNTREFLDLIQASIEQIEQREWASAWLHANKDNVDWAF